MTRPTPGLLLATMSAPLVAAPPADLPLPEFVDIFCLDCHRQDANVDLRPLAIDLADPEIDPNLLRRVRDRLRARDMPPVDVSIDLETRLADRPSEDEYVGAVAALGVELDRRASRAGVPGVVLRRLNRRELASSIQDVFEVDIDPGSLPADDVGHGFDHLGEVLSTSPLLVERIVDVAESVARRAIVDAETAIAEVRTIPLDHTRGGAVRAGGSWLVTNGEVAADVTLPRPGRYRAEFDLAGRQAGGEPVRFALRLDRGTRLEVEVPETPDRPSTHSFEFESDAPGVRIAAAFLNDHYAPEHPDPAERDRNGLVVGMRLVGPLDAGEPTPFQRRMNGWMREGDLRMGLARAARRLLERCWSRPIPSDEARRVAELVLEACAAATPEDSRRERPSASRCQQAMVVYAIASPEFLYRIERPRPGADAAADGSVPLDGYSLAARLGAFLRGGLPDDRLLEAARRGRLDDDEGLLRETRRLLRTEAARSLGERFAVQWLHVDGVEGLEPDPGRHGEISEALLAEMREETVRAFAEIVEDDRPITDLLEQSTTWLTPSLARHYGLDPAAIGLGEDRGDGHDSFHRVDLAAAGVPHAGLGVLRHASVLASTSNPGRTSPVRRGRWVLESLLDAPPPPPPPGVAQLPDARDPGTEPTTLREMLEAHRADPDCAACHVRMDAIGFALEPFDAVGRWRSDDEGVAIDARADFPDGSTANGPLELRDLLVRDPAFKRSFAKHLLVYALGRGPDWRDEPLIDDLAGVLDETPTVAAVVEAIVLSDAFRRRPSGSATDSL